MDTESLSAALTPLFPSPHLFTARVVGRGQWYHRGVPSPLARRARAASGRGRRRARRWRPAGVTPAHGSPRCAARHRHLLPAGCRQRIARIQSAPAKFYSGWSCARGEKSLGQGHELFQGATGGVRLPLKGGAAGSASCSSCPPTTTGGRDRRLPPSVSSSQHPRPAVTEQPVGPAYRGDGTTGAGTGGGGGTGRTFCGPDPSGASIHAPFTRITISPIGASP